jgi:hypothetical protein
VCVCVCVCDYVENCHSFRFLPYPKDQEVSTSCVVRISLSPPNSHCRTVDPYSFEIRSSVDLRLPCNHLLVTLPILHFFFLVIRKLNVDVSSSVYFLCRCNSFNMSTVIFLVLFFLCFYFRVSLHFLKDYNRRVTVPELKGCERNPLRRGEDMQCRHL